MLLAVKWCLNAGSRRNHIRQRHQGKNRRNVTVWFLTMRLTMRLLLVRWAGSKSTNCGYCSCAQWQGLTFCLLPLCCRVEGKWSVSAARGWAGRLGSCRLVHFISCSSGTEPRTGESSNLKVLILFAFRLATPVFMAGLLQRWGAYKAVLFVWFFLEFRLTFYKSCHEFQRPYNHKICL